MEHVAPSTPSERPAAAERLPRRFGRYLLFDRIGKGGMAEIFLARAATELGATRLVVVKQILPELAGDPGFAKMLIAEAKLAARLRNANVVQVYDLGREDERLFIAMEYVEGFDLHALLRNLSRTKTPLPAEFAIFVVREVLSALSYAHRAKADDGAPLGIVHRDVSPSNVLISFEGEVKLCDFGIARAMAVATADGPAASDATAALDARHEGATSASKIAGKSAYMAPEHARGENIDARADVFAAGILLWELCAGRRMYRGTEAEMLAQARVGAVPPLPERGLPETALLQAVIACALAPDVAARFATASDFQKALDDYAGKARLVASPLRFGTFLTENFSADLVARRRSRERGAAALELGPPAVLEPIGSGPLPQSTTSGAEHHAPSIAEDTTAALPVARVSSRPSPARAPAPAPERASAPTPTPAHGVASGERAQHGVSPIVWALMFAALSALAVGGAWFAGWFR